VAAVEHRLDPPAEGGDERRLGEVLERAHAALRARRAPRHHHHRRAGEVGVGEPGHGVGEPRPGGGEDDSDAAAEVRLGLGHVHRGALVADVDDLDAEPVQRVPHRLDVAAAEPEDPGHPAAAEVGGEELGDGGDAHGQKTAVSE